MQGPPGQGLPPGFVEPDKHDLDGSALIDPSLDPSLSNPDDPKIIIARLRQELDETKRHYLDEINKLNEQLMAFEEESQKLRSELDMMHARMEDDNVQRIELERRCQDAEVARQAAEQKLNFTGILPTAEEGGGNDPDGLMEDSHGMGC